MVEPIPNLPDNVLGFKAIGRVTSEDYETVLIPAVDAQNIGVRHAGAGTYFQ